MDSNWFPGPGAAQTPKIDDFRPAQKSCIKNPSVWNGAHGFKLVSRARGRPDPENRRFPAGPKIMY